MDLRRRNWLQVIAALAILGMAALTWIHRDRVEAAATAILGSGTAGPTEPAGVRQAGRGRAIQRQALPVIAARVGEARDDVVIEAIGTARARRSVTLYPPIAGEIIIANITAGQRVTKAEQLLVLDPKKAQLAVRMAQSKRLDAERKLARAEQLRSRNVGSRANVDDARTAFERAQVELSQAQETLKDLSIRAPFAGVLGIPKVEVGDRITPATALTTLDDRAELRVEFEVPERYMPRLRADHAVAARTPGFPGEVFRGRIRSIDSRIDPTARTVTVRAVIPNGADRLRPGMSFAVAVTLAGKPYPVVPELALQFSQSGNYVWAIETESVRKVPVSLVRRIDSAALIDGPLKPGTLVVVEGVQRLRPGRKVRFAKPPSGPPRPRQAVN